MALVAPSCAPGVSDDPVVLGTLGTPADNGDCVVNAGWAVRLSSKNTTSVHGENVVASGESDRNNTLLDSSLVCSSSLSNSRVALDVDTRVLWFALSIFALVWVLRLSVKLRFLEIVPSPEVPSTAASMGCWVAVDKLLLGEADKFIGSFPVCCLKSSVGRESPA